MAANEWIAQIAAGDRKAFRAAYEKYGKTIYQRALEQTGNREQAQAVLKNVFRTLFRQLQDSSCDPLLFLLEGLTDLETGAAAVQDSAAANKPAQAKDRPSPTSAQESPAAEETRENAPSDSPFDRAETELGGEYASAALTPEKLRSLSDTPSLFAAQPENSEADPVSESDFAEADPPKAHRGLTAFLIVLLVLLVLLTLWFGAGVLMMYSVLPKIDLGYGWFNEHLFNLFRF